MIKDIQARVEKVFHRERGYLTTANNEVLSVKDIIYFTNRDRKLYAVTAGERYPVTLEFTALEKLFKGLFIRPHHYYLVNLSRITHISRRYPTLPQEVPLERDVFIEETKECELHLDGLKETISVTETYYEKVQKILDIKSFDHLVPDNSEDKKFREMEILQFGWRELFRLDPADSQAVNNFIRKWDIKLFSKPKMLKYFRQVGKPELDKRKVIKNILYQLYQFIKKGIEPPSDGNIRSMWYRIKAVLAYHSNVLEPGDVDIYYSALTQMIEEYELFKYKDFGFMDINEPYRGIGTRRPEIILAAEKLGFYSFIRPLAKDVGASFICLKGEPAHISLEYFSDDLVESVGDKKKKVFVISDIDPAGYSIERNLIDKLKKHGHEFDMEVTLVDLSIFDDEQIGYSRVPIVRYEIKGNEIIPFPPAGIAQVTKACNWFDEVVQDERLRTVTEINNRKIVTIWGVECDAAERPKIEQRFRDAIG